MTATLTYALLEAAGVLMNCDEFHEAKAFSPWFHGVRRLVKRWSASGAGKNWVVAVSGGGDSVALLRLLHVLAPELGLTLSVAHLDHGTRGDESRADAAFVQELAAAFGLHCDVGRWGPERTGHFESDARRARYSWLMEVAMSRGASAVAVGHTSDDQAETILQRIVRGTGLRGLTGMPARRVLSTSPPVILVRPLLAVSRQEVRATLEQLGQPFREDASNADLSRTRARIRRDLLPRLVNEYNPRAAEAIVRLGKLANGAYRALENQFVEMEREAARLLSSERIELRRDRLRQYPAYLRAELLRRVWRQAGWPEVGMNSECWRRMALLARGMTIERQSLTADIELVTTGQECDPSDCIILTRLSRASRCAFEPVEAPALLLEVPGAAQWSQGELITSIDPLDVCDETIDLDRVLFPMLVRGPLPGDRFQPLGLCGKSMALNDFFRGRSLRREDRLGIPLLCDSGGIIWVVGHRIADRVKLTGETRRRLYLRWATTDRGR